MSKQDEKLQELAFYFVKDMAAATANQNSQSYECAAQSLADLIKYVAIKTRRNVA